MPRYIVCYDIASDRRRRKISECLDGYGDRVQESVFELPVDRPLFDKCIAEVARLIDSEQDHLAIYLLCATCEERRQYLGVGETMPRIGEEDVFIV